jgi:hypothetical protein
VNILLNSCLNFLFIAAISKVQFGVTLSPIYVSFTVGHIRLTEFEVTLREIWSISTLMFCFKCLLRIPRGNAGCYADLPVLHIFVWGLLSLCITVITSLTCLIGSGVA